MSAVRDIELLAPARDAQIARQANMYGADAVYLGGPSHGARAAASNTIDDIAQVVELAHLYGVKVYVTLNTIIYDNELGQVQDTIRQLYDIGVDALIIQDMAILRMDIPPIDLHASTQCDIRTPDKARFLAQCGFSQLVLPREMSLDEIRKVSDTVGPDIRLEAFVHGALCVSYSGDCQASCLSCGRSANRGECAQMCRMAYTLVDGDGREVVRDKHLLSLRDLNRLDDVGALIDAGVSSLKIEGRLKDAAYVKTVVSAYRRAIDDVIARSKGRYRRASYGRSVTTIPAQVEDVFNRGFTRYFIDGRPKEHLSMICVDSPKWTGRKVGEVISCNGRELTAKLIAELHNGDGLGYFDSQGRFNGFRLNRIDGNKLYPATPVDIPVGTVLYRNRDTRLDALLAQDTAKRLIDVTMRLHLDNKLTLRIEAENGCVVQVCAEATIDKARAPQKQAREKILSKLGSTPFVLSCLDDQLDEWAFVPASQLTALRQQATEALTKEIIACYQRRQRLPEDPQAVSPKAYLTYHDNVANHLAEDFYRSHGATEIEPAIELNAKNIKDPRLVMTTRYCLRRELGACLLTPEGKRLKGPLRIKNDAATFQLDFDCRNCQMRVITDTK